MAKKKVHKIGLFSFQAQLKDKQGWEVFIEDSGFILISDRCF